MKDPRWYSNPKSGKFDVSDYKDHRNTWIRSRELVEKMMQRIQWEQEHPDSTPFKLLGENSFLARKYSYLDTTHPELIEMEKENPKKFEEILELTKQKRNWEKSLEKKSVDFSGLEPTELPVKMSLTNPPVTALALGAGCLFLINPALLPVSIGTLIGMLGMDMWGGKKLKQKIEENRELINKVEQKSKECMIWSQNCFNGARRWLKMIEVYLPEKCSDERICVIPSSYLPNKKETL